MNQNRWLSIIVAIALLCSSFLIVPVLFSSNTVPQAEAIAPTTVTGNWEWINYASDGGSYSPQTQINNDNVQWLEMKWLFPFQSGIATSYPNTVQEGAGAPLLIVDGVVYSGKNKKDVHAVDAKTGEEVWYSDVLLELHDWDQWLAEFPFMQGQYGHTHAMNFYREQGWLIMSSAPCWLAALNAADGTLAWEMTPDQLCGTKAQLGDPLNGIVGSFSSKGYMSAIQNHPPQIVDNILVWPSMGASGRGGRSSIIGFDISDPNNPVQVWRNWVMPPGDGSVPTWAIDECNRTNGQVWYFEYPNYLATGQLAKNCRDVPEDAVMNDWINMKPNTPHYGEIHTASAFSVIWGNMPVLMPDGIVYMGTGDIGPYPNGTLRFGPNLHGSAIIAIKASTGELVWSFASNPHDLWDMDCSWGGILAKVGSKDALVKACKNGVMFALDARTGEPIWIFDPPSIERDLKNWNYGVDASLNDPLGPDACCNMVFEHMNKDWMMQNSPDCAAGDQQACDGIAHGPNAWAHIESDFAFDGKNYYVGVQNSPREFQINNVRDFGNQGSTIQQIEPKNSTIWAVDGTTGEPVWSQYIEGVSYRGGVMTSGGVVYAYASDGNLYMMDADTGELLAKKLFGVPISVMPTIGADRDGNHKIFLYIGGGGGFLFASNQLPGSVAAYGLPDQLPEPVVRIEEIERVVEVQVEGPERVVEIEKEVQVIKEVEVVVEKDVPVEVERIVEVEKQVEVEVITTEEVVSPISYIAIGLGVVLVVVAGVLYQRSKA
jgi:glucose dehydrogenase